MGLLGDNGVGMTSRVVKDETAKRGAKVAEKVAEKNGGKHAKPATKKPVRGLTFSRMATERGVDPLDQVTWERRASVITNPDGSVVFKMEGAEIPSSWSQLATDIVVNKYSERRACTARRSSGRRACARSSPARAHNRETGKPYAVLGNTRGKRQANWHWREQSRSNAGVTGPPGMNRRGNG